ncbi:hypothetical protein BcepSauron_359 [Burkholderia phage BcepSauron]|uniref:Uncharacterized protein n=2 Tax=Sarumanvirus TaxID=2843450 RepID=A0A482MM48_9CAUD|nr:hypothetical protein H1O16_gp356 [Burkholderia phage BcepSaruman]YP_009904737.1 hypothetical protein H1O17_gp359 [Burkholderia phage BcepSauron]QBQ74739.1 hypothetical protein BcepSauron_359 [Burkholderia phage BcepSauron]QBX06769.1 hypothetical protein BcepSaruman_356 [Burkholderia phage BcepSaruman]
MSELWENPLFSLEERLEIAAGAVQFHKRIIAQLRAKCAEAAVKLDEVSRNADSWHCDCNAIDDVADRLRELGDAR